MIYNCYIKDNQYYVDIAKSDSEIVTKKYKFSMLLGFLGNHLPQGSYRFIDKEFNELYTGIPLKVVEFNNHYKYRQFTKENKDKIIFGLIDPIYYCMTYHFKEPLKVYNPNFYTLDIEVYSKNEFPDPHRADYVINLITICNYQEKKYYTWGLKPFINESEYDVQYNHCRSELDLLESLIEFIVDNNIKCFTGWNTNGFDVPYIINRLRKFEAKSFIIQEYIKENINMYGKDKSFTTIQVIDYMELYKKFKSGKIERYSLDFVSQFEGFQGKNKYIGSLADLSDNRWYDYVLYNIVDNYAITQLEDKLKYMKQLFSMANDNKCLPSDIFSPVKMWDCAIYYELFWNRNCLPPPCMSDVTMKLLGGFVGLPNTNGFQKWISVFDIASSYPHQIMQFNISPETIINPNRLHSDLVAIREHFKPSLSQMNECPDKQFQTEFNALKKEIRKRGVDFVEDNITDEDLNIYRVKYNVWRFSIMDFEKEFPFTETLKKHNVTMTANIQFYRKDRIGLLPSLIKKYFDIRNDAKKNEELLELHIDSIKKQIGIEDKKVVVEYDNDDIEYLEDEELDYEDV